MTELHGVRVRPGEGVTVHLRDYYFHGEKRFISSREDAGRKPGNPPGTSLHLARTLSYKDTQAFLNPQPTGNVAFIGTCSNAATEPHSAHHLYSASQTSKCSANIAHSHLTCKQRSQDLKLGHLIPEALFHPRCRTDSTSTKLILPAASQFLFCLSPCL